MTMRLLSALLFLPVLCALSAPPTAGQYELRKRRANGLYDSYGITLLDGQMIGQIDGVPAAVNASGLGIANAAGFLKNDGSGSLQWLAAIPSASLEATGITGGTYGNSGVTFSLSVNDAGQITGLTPLNIEPLDSFIQFGDITTGNASTTKHGFLRKLSGSASDVLKGDGSWGTVSASASWGGITGTLSSQTDLQTALNAKLSTTTAASTYQPLDADLTSIAALTTTSFGRSVLETANASALRTLAGVVIGTDVQAYNSNLATLAAGFGAIYTAPGLLQWNGSGYAVYSGVLPVSLGGTGINALSIATGDLLYGTGSSSWARLSGNTSASMQVLTSTGTGLSAQAPAWTSASGFKAGLALDLVENTALSTWAGSGNITTLGTVTSGTFRGATVQPAYGGTGQTSYTDGQLLIGNSTGGGLAKATLTGGSGITVTNGGGSITLSIASNAVTNAMLAGSIANSKLATDPLARANHTGTQAASTITALPVEIVVACSDETTALTTGTAKVTFRMPHAMTLTAVRLNVNTAPTGSAIVVDVKEAGTTIFSTKPQIATSAFTSVGGAVPGTLSDTSLADDAEITINLDQIGASVAGKGLKITLVGTR